MGELVNWGTGHSKVTCGPPSKKARSQAGFLASNRPYHHGRKNVCVVAVKLPYVTVTSITTF